MATSPNHAGKQAIEVRLISWRWLAVACLGLSTAVNGQNQDPAALQAHAERYLKTQTASLPGKVSIRVTAPRSELPACAALDAFQPVGGRRMGKTTVGVRCLAPSPWTVYLQAQIRVEGSYAVTRQSLPANHTITAGDITLREGDLGNLPVDVITDIDDMLGYRTVSGLAANAPLRRAMVRAPLAVQQGQITRVVLNGPGFSVQSEGQALANASRGDQVRVKTRSGQVVSGIAQDGQQIVVAY